MSEKAKQLNDEIVSLLVARERYRKLSELQPKSYDSEVLGYLTERINALKARLRTLTRSVQTG